MRIDAIAATWAHPRSSLSAPPPIAATAYHRAPQITLQTTGESDGDRPFDDSQERRARHCRERRHAGLSTTGNHPLLTLLPRLRARPRPQPASSSWNGSACSLPSSGCVHPRNQPRLSAFPRAGTTTGFTKRWAQDTTGIPRNHDVPEHADRTREGYYSIFQIDHLHLVLTELTLNVRLDFLLDQQANRPIDWHTHGTRWMENAETSSAEPAPTPLPPRGCLALPAHIEPVFSRDPDRHAHRSD